MPLGVQRPRSAPEQELDAAIGVPAARPQGERLRVELAGQDLLGERRAVVGHEGLGTHERDAAAVPGPAQRLAAALRGQAASGDDDPCAHTASLAAEHERGDAVNRSFEDSSH
jgi:hypothetical protein